MTIIRRRLQIGWSRLSIYKAFNWDVHPKKDPGWLRMLHIAPCSPLSNMWGPHVKPKPRPAVWFRCTVTHWIGCFIAISKDLTLMTWWWILGRHQKLQWICFGIYCLVSKLVPGIWPVWTAIIVRTVHRTLGKRERDIWYIYIHIMYTVYITFFSLPLSAYIYIICVCVCAMLYLSICLFVCLSMYLSTYLPI